MQLDIRHINIPVSNALEGFARRRIERALRPFLASVGRVEVRIEDENGPRGGEDMRCTLTAEVAPAKRKVVVTSKSSDAYAAIQKASASLEQAVSRALKRRRQLDRSPAASRPQSDEVDEAALRTFAEEHGAPRLGPVVVVIAAYDEEPGIGVVLESLPTEVLGLHVDVLVVDDWALSPLTAEQRNDILEILEDSYGNRSTIFASQLDSKH